MKFLILVFLFTAACVPRFNTTKDPRSEIEIENNKNKIKSIYGTWNYHFDGKDFSYDMQLVIDVGMTKVSTTCYNQTLETSITSISHSNVELDKLVFVDGITGTIQAGYLECGLNFPAAVYPASVRGVILTLITANGPINFRRAGP